MLAPRATVCALSRAGLGHPQDSSRLPVGVAGPCETRPWKRSLAFRGPCRLGFPWFFDHDIFRSRKSSTWSQGA